MLVSPTNQIDKDKYAYGLRKYFILNKSKLRVCKKLGDRDQKLLIATNFEEIQSLQK